LAKRLHESKIDGPTSNSMKHVVRNTARAYGGRPPLYAGDGVRRGLPNKNRLCLFAYFISFTLRTCYFKAGI